jgi:hypothetical protein
MAVPPHRVRLPDPSGLFKKADREDRDFMVELVAALQRELDQRITFRTAQGEVLLFSPDGAVWSVSVGNTGTVTTVKRSGP